MLPLPPHPPLLSLSDKELCARKVVYPRRVKLLVQSAGMELTHSVLKTCFVFCFCCWTWQTLRQKFKLPFTTSGRDWDAWVLLCERAHYFSSDTQQEGREGEITKFNTSISKVKAVYVVLKLCHYMSVIHCLFFAPSLRKSVRLMDAGKLQFYRYIYITYRYRYLCLYA